MKTVTVELLTPVRNNAVIRFPQRRFPGIVIQGDSLAILVEQVRVVCDHIDAKHGVLREDVSLLLDLVEEMQSQYESALEEHGIALPYAKRSDKS